MKNDNLGTVVAVVILAPIVAGAITTVAIGAINAGIAITNKVRKAKFEKKMKKGIEEGTIIEIDGNYYEVEQTKDIIDVTPSIEEA